MQIQPPGWRPQRGITYHWSDAGMHVAAHGAVPMRFRVQREIPHHHSQPYLLMPVWQLHRQQPAGEEKARVRFTLMITICSSGPIDCKQYCYPHYNKLKSIRSPLFFFLFVKVSLLSWLQLYVFRVCEKTHSLWSHLCANQSDYLNPLYRPGHSQAQGLLRPSTAPHCFK